MAGRLEGSLSQLPSSRWPIVPNYSTENQSTKQEMRKLTAESMHNKGKTCDRTG
jgi:hypothetical protein